MAVQMGEMTNVGGYKQLPPPLAPPKTSPVMEMPEHNNPLS